MRAPAKIKHPRGFGTEKTRVKRKIWYAIDCTKHGKNIKVTAPRTRRERYTMGCPFCKMEAKHEAAI